MKKFLSVFLIMIVTLSLFTTVVFSTEATDETENFEITEEQLQQLLEGTDYESLIEKVEYFEGKVINSGEITKKEDEGVIVQNCQVQMVEGDKKGEIIDAKAILGYEGYEESMSASFEKGEYVYVTFVDETAEDGTTIVQIPYIVEVNRSYAYIAIIILILILLLVLSLFKGIETIGLIIYNVLVITLGIVFMYYNQLNEILSFSTIVVLLIIGDSIILSKFKKETIVVVLGSLISIITGIGILTILNQTLKLQGFVGYFDLSALIMTIPMIGITIDVVRRTIKKAKQGKSFKLTIKDVFEKLPSKYNMVLLVWAGFFIENAVSMQSYLLDNEYPFNFLNFGSIAMEFSKLAVLIITPIIAIPITMLLSKEILKIKKTIDAPSDKAIDMK